MDECSPKRKMEKSIQTYPDASNFSFELNKVRKALKNWGLSQANFKQLSKWYILNCKDQYIIFTTHKCDVSAKWILEEVPLPP